MFEFYAEIVKKYSLPYVPGVVKLPGLGLVQTAALLETAAPSQPQTSTIDKLNSLPVVSTDGRVPSYARQPLEVKSLLS